MRIGNWLGNHSTTILTVTGIGTGILAGILFANAGAKVAHEIEVERESRIDESKDLEPKEKAMIFVKHMWLPCAVEGLSIVAILGSNRIHNIRTAAALTSANLATQALTDYRSEVKKQLGENTDRKVRDGVAQNKVNEDFSSSNEEKITPINAKQVGDVLCKDSITGRYFWSTPEKLHRAENWIVSEINEDFSADLNDWYGAIAIEPICSGIGEYLEWTPDDHFSIYLSTAKTPDERPCIYVEYNPYPKARERHIADY